MLQEDEASDELVHVRAHVREGILSEPTRAQYPSCALPLHREFGISAGEWMPRCTRSAPWKCGEVLGLFSAVEAA
jgi:hypothetical protein